MQSRKFLPEVDFQTLNQWLHAHNHQMVEYTELPVSGYVVEDWGIPVAMAFLRMVEGDSAIAESLVTDPSAPLCKRVKAIDQIIEKLCQVAKDRGIKHLIATTVSTGVLTRISKRHGFVKSEQILLVKKL